MGYNLYMKKYVISGILLAFLAISSLSYASTTTFTRYLQKGDRGADVTVLQKVLNTDLMTQVSVTGEGSAGFETDFFGELTKQAVIKLQKKENLGNSYGFFTIYSGALDDKTRSFLNTKLDNAESATTTGSSDQEKLNAIYRESNFSEFLPKIDSINPSSVTNGESITITGKNFSTTTPNTVRMTFNTTSVVSLDGTTLTVKAQSAIQNMFDTEAKGLNKEGKDNVKGIIGSLPMNITVQNSFGVSNPYQIYVKIK